MFAEDRAWAQGLLRARIDDAQHRLRRYCKKPKSAKRLHRTRKALARLRSAIEDVGRDGNVNELLYANVRALHRAAGKVRDADVLLARLKTYAGVTDLQQRSQALELVGTLRKKRKKARRKLQALIAATPVLEL